MISCLILTKNEELNLPACLNALAWCDDILVLDCGSTDRTVEIAERAGARVFFRDWDSERAQRTYSLSLPFKYPWVYNPDADEVLSPELRQEMIDAITNPSLPHVAYRMRFRVIFMDQWIRRSSLYPTWFLRLFRPECLSFEREVNMRYVVNGSVGMLQKHFDHFTFRKGIHHWFTKHNEYSSYEAAEALKVLKEHPFEIRALLSRDPIEQRRAWKDLSFRVPGRSVATLFYLLFIRGGVLDGPAGWAFCGLRASYELMIELKLWEFRNGEAGGSAI